tara:strand:+ start:24533 stop:25864 length:1332 start_codon:yes stop_codon:yes gene_type:complete
MRIYADGIFDLFHNGHRLHLERLKALHDDVYLIIGVISDEDASSYKRKPIVDENTRLQMVRNEACVDEAHMTPLIMTKDFIQTNRIDFVYHAFANKQDENVQSECFRVPKEMGIFRTIPYIEGISTTNIIANMRQNAIITHQNIKSLNIPTRQLVECVLKTYTDSSIYRMPKKVVIRGENKEFWTSMPITSGSDFQVKMVWRNGISVPSIKASITLVENDNINVIDGTWITSWRTGILASLSAHMITNGAYNIVAIHGLGNCATAALLALAELTTKPFCVRLVRYKDYAIRFAKRFSEYKNITFEEYDTPEECVNCSPCADIFFSAVTLATTNILENIPKGIVLVPIHVRGFSKFDNLAQVVVTDSVEGISHFKHFDTFKHNIVSTSELLTEKRVKKESDTVIIYQYGTALSDYALTKFVLNTARAANVGSYFVQQPIPKNYI